MPFTHTLHETMYIANPNFSSMHRAAKIREAKEKPRLLNFRCPQKTAYHAGYILRANHHCSNKMNASLEAPGIAVP